MTLAVADFDAFFGAVNDGWRAGRTTLANDEKRNNFFHASA